MSAAAAASIPTTIRAICRTPMSFFNQLLDICNFTELRCFALILDLTVGRPQVWADIPYESFEESCVVSREHIHNAIAQLEKYKLIRIRQGDSGRRQYAVSENIQAEANAQKIRGKCSSCHTIATFESRYVAVPHAALRKLGACVDHATYVVTMMIVRDTLKWQGDRGVWIEPAEIEKADFERFTGLDSRQISNALKHATELGIITRQDRPGRASIYAAVPEAFATIDRREARVISMPSPSREKTANVKPSKSSQEPTKAGESHAIESHRSRYCYCGNCGAFAEIEAVEEQEVVQSTQTQPRKVGPVRESERKLTKSELAIERVRAKLRAEAEDIAC